MTTPSSSAPGADRTIVVIVADRGAGAATLGILRDWSAVGLVRPFLWVTPNDDPTGRVAAWSVHPDGARPTSLEAYLADIAGDAEPTHIRVTALDSLAGEPVLPTAQTVLKRLRVASPGGQVTRIHLIAVTIGMESERPYEGTDGWHRMVLSPEDRFSPTSPADHVHASDDPTGVAMHVAAGLSGISGLWVGIDESPLDGRNYAPGTRVALCRTFLRRVDAGPATWALQEGLTDFSAGLPRPVHQSTALPHFEDEYEAVRKASRTLLDHYDWLLAGERVTPPPPTRTRIGFLRAMKLFLSFIWAAMRNAPRDWLHRTIADGETWMARVGQAFIGRDSEYQLVVRGRRSDGSLASAEQVDQAVGRARGGHREGAHQEDLPRLGLLWRDFFEVGLSLVDGMHRVSAIDQPRVGPLPGVVRESTSVAAPADRAFTGIPAHVAAELGVGAIHPADLYLSETVLRELDDRSRGSAAGLELGRVRERLAGWRESVQLRSFAGDFGYQLAARIVELRTEIEALQATLAALVTPADIDDGFAQRQEALARRARLFIWAGLLIPVLLYLAHRFNWLSGMGVLLAGLGALLVWMVTLTVMFAIGQARLFRLLNRQVNDRGAAEAARANLSAALSDLDRVLCAYGSYRHWAAILGTLVTRPFGAPAQHRPTLRRLTGPLPRAVQVGSISPSPQALLDATAALRPLVFVAGWLDNSYQAFLGTAAPAVQTASLTGDQRVAALFTELSRRDSDSLAHLAQLIDTHGVGSQARERFWENAAAQLAQPNLSGVRASVLGNIRWSGDRSAELDAMGDSLGQSGRTSSSFAGEVLSSDARAQGALIVETERSARLSGRGTALGQNLCVTEFGRSFSAEGLNIGVTPRAGRPTAAAASRRPADAPGSYPGTASNTEWEQLPGADPLTGRRL